MQLWLGAVSSRFDAGPIAVRRGSAGRVIANEVGWRAGAVSSHVDEHVGPPPSRGPRPGHLLNSEVSSCRLASTRGRREGAPVEFRVLGRIEVVGADGPIELRGPKRRALMGLLLVEQGRIV